MSNEETIEITITLNKDDVRTLILGSHSSTSDASTVSPDEDLAKLLGKLYCQALAVITSELVNCANKKFDVS